MSIKITVGKTPEEVAPITIKLKIRRLLNNDFCIDSHSIIDIIIQRGPGKVLALPKKALTDSVYEVQCRFFDFLSSLGVIDRASIQGGEIYGSVEAKVFGDDKEKSEQALLLALKKFLNEELPLESLTRELEREEEERLTEPDDDESTELGDVPHNHTKGNMPSSIVSLPGTAFFLEEKKNKSNED